MYKCKHQCRHIGKHICCRSCKEICNDNKCEENPEHCESGIECTDEEEKE